MCKIGFTGTKNGMTFNQKFGVNAYLVKWYEEGGMNEFHHGLCIGADCEAAVIAKKLNYRVIAYPGFPARARNNHSYRGSFDRNDLVMPEEEFLARNQRIVKASNLIIATPKERYEVIRSGTWATIRYAIKNGKKLIIILPNGTVQKFNEEGK